MLLSLYICHDTTDIFQALILLVLLFWNVSIDWSRYSSRAAKYLHQRAKHRREEQPLRLPLTRRLKAV